MDKKPTAELIAFLRSWGKHDSLGEKEYVVVPLKQVNQAADRLAEQEAEIERLKKAHNAFEVYITGWVSKDYSEWGNEIYQHVMRGGQYNGEEINEYHPIEEALPDYKALQQTTEGV